MSASDAYRFANTIWIDDVLGRSMDRSMLLRAVAFAAAPWALGLILSGLYGLATQFIRTPLFYIGSAGIFLTSIGIVYGSARQYGIYDRMTSCFELSEDTKRGHILTALGRHSDFWNHILAATIIWIIGSFLVVSSLYMWPVVAPIAVDVGTKLPRFRALEIFGWYEPNIKTTTAAVIEVYLIPISLVLGTSASIMLRMPLFLWNLSRERPRIPPALVKSHFAPAASFYSTISLLWLVGVGLMLYLFGLNRDWASYSFVLAAFVFGAINFSVPQVAYIRTITASEDIYLAKIADSLELHNAILPDSLPAQDNSSVFSDFSLLEPLIQLLKHEEWVYPLHQTYVVIGTYALSLFASAFGWQKFIALINH